MSGEMQAVVGVIGTIAVAFFAFLGVRSQSRAAQTATDRASRKEERDSALEAWERLIEPTLKEVERLRSELAEERAARLAQQDETQQRQDRADQEQRSLKTMIEDLTDQVQTWQRVAKTIARWATSLRDEVLRLGGTVPATPEELLTLQAIDGHHGDDDHH